MGGKRHSEPEPQAGTLDIGAPSFDAIEESEVFIIFVCKRQRMYVRIFMMLKSVEKSVGWSRVVLGTCFLMIRPLFEFESESFGGGGVVAILGSLLSKT